MTPEDCQRFNECSAPLCPLDSKLDIRVWWADEDICKSQKHNQHRWIRKQRSIQRRQTKSWLDVPVSKLELFDASRKKKMSEEQLDILRKRMGNIRRRKP